MLAAGAPDATESGGAPAGKVGSLIVGDEVGLGGKLMRTVSFFGWTLPVSFLGGTPPPGAPGMLSAITRISYPKTRGGLGGCQTLIPS